MVRQEASSHATKHQRRRGMEQKKRKVKTPALTLSMRSLTRFSKLAGTDSHELMIVTQLTKIFCYQGLSNPRNTFSTCQATACNSIWRTCGCKMQVERIESAGQERTHCDRPGPQDSHREACGSPDENKSRAKAAAAAREWP